MEFSRIILFVHDTISSDLIHKVWKKKPLQALLIGKWGIVKAKFLNVYREKFYSYPKNENTRRIHRTLILIA